jgi:PAS domain S-box-containing protein
LLLSAVDFEQAVELIDSVIAPGPIGCSIVDRAYRYVRINDQLAALNGRHPKDHIGRTMQDILGESIWSMIKPQVDRALRGETISDTEFSAPSPADPNTQLFIRRTYVPLVVSGDVVGMVTLARDVTARTRAEQALERSELRFQQLVDTAEEGIWIVDADHLTTFVNPQMAKMLGYAVDEMVGTSMYNYLDGETQRIAARYMKRRRSSDRDKREFRFRRKDGSDAWMLIATTAMPSHNDEYFGTVGLFTDITHRKHAEIERERILEQERAAREEAERVRHRIATTLESIKDGFVSFDADWKYTYVNRHAARMLEREPLDLIGKGVWEEAPEAVGRPFHRACLDAIRDQMPIEIEELEDRSGRWFAYQLFPSKEGLSVFFHEITERKRIEAEKIELLKKVEAAANVQRVFLKDMLSAVTDKRLVLCWTPEELPRELPGNVWSFGPITPDELPLLRQMLRDEGERLGYERCRIQDMIIGASEAAMNSIVHGGGGSAQICSQDDGPIQVWLRDTGRGITMEQMPRAVLERGFTTAGSMGHGMKMMLHTIDRIWLLSGRQGTTVVLEQSKSADRPLFE